MQAKPLQLPATWAAEESLDLAAAQRRQLFIRMYDEYFVRIYNYACYRSGDGVIADDLAAQTFERAFIHFNDYQPERAPFAAWLFTIARNVVSNYLRSERSRNHLSLEICTEQPDDNSLPEDRLIHGETQLELLRAIKRLGERERDILGLKFAAGMTNRRIAEITGLSETHVGVIIYRSLHRLKEFMSIGAGR